MAGKIIVSTLQSDTDNSISFVANTGATIFSANLSHGIAGSFIGDGSVTNAKLAGSITGDKIATGQITGNLIANNTITGNKIATGQITGNLLTANCVSGNNIVSSPTITGNVTINGSLSLGGATTPSSGIGIKFPATQIASADGNTLDDYEEGTWTPSLTQAVGLSISSATYQKIGNRVFLNAFISIDSNSNGNDFLIAPSSLPYAMASGTNASVGAFNNEGEDLYAYAEQGNGIYIRTNTNGSKTCIALSTNFVAFQLNYTV